MEVSVNKSAITIKKNPGYPTINNTIDAYVSLIEKWDPKEINTRYRVKTLGLNDENEVICEISFDAHSDTIVKDAIESLKIAKSENAKKIIVGQNKALRQFYPGANDKKLARRLDNYAKSLNMSIEDQLVVTENSYYSYAENEKKELNGAA